MAGEKDKHDDGERAVDCPPSRAGGPPTLHAPLVLDFFWATAPAGASRKRRASEGRRSLLKICSARLRFIRQGRMIKLKRFN